MTSGTDVTRNVDAAVDLVLVAAGEGATYVQLPEYFNYLGPQSKFAAVAESIPGPTTQRFGEVARSCAATIHLGSMLERSTVSGKCYNTSVVLDASGAIVATYRKAHLFDVDVPGVFVQRESDAIVAGDQLVVGVDLVILARPIEVPFGGVHTGLCQRRAQIFQVDAVG